MLKLKTQHPDFDLGMEILCSLPPRKPGVPVAALKADFGRSVPTELERLVMRGHKIQTAKVRGEDDALHLVAWCSPDDLPAAQTYWAKVYEGWNGPHAE